MGKVTDKKIIECIKNIIKREKEKHCIKDAIIMDGVFSVLKEECTLLYYPLLEENTDGNKGFHITKIVNGQEIDFVYINTAYEKECQIFCAAHELGHIWKIDEVVEKELGITLLGCEREGVINRFAAEFMMPEDEFIEEARKKMKSLPCIDGKITHNDFCRLCTCLMDRFFEPYVAVVRRCNEVGAISDDVAEELEKEYEKKPEMLRPFIIEGQYTRINSENKLKTINDIQDMVNEAAEKGVMSTEALKSIRELFDLPDMPSDEGGLLKYGEFEK